MTFGNNTPEGNSHEKSRGIARYFFFLVGFLLISACYAKLKVRDMKSSPANSMADFCKNLPRSEYKAHKRVAFESDWFELYEVAPGVTAIYEPHQWQEVISYLIQGKEKALLFDTGNGLADISAVVKYLTSKPVLVLNSHTHYDHVGGNYSFKKIYGMNTRFTRSRQSGHLNNDIAIEASKEALCRALPKGVTQQNHVGRPFRITQFITDGFVFDLGERSLQVIHIPGHTPDAIALIDRENRLMWTGDSYYSGPIWLHAPETDLPDYGKSLDRLIQEISNVDVLLPAHNTPRIKPSVLYAVRNGFNKMLNGEAIRNQRGDGMVEYRLPDEGRFSFLMRDESLPYKANSSQ